MLWLGWGGTPTEFGKLNLWQKEDDMLRNADESEADGAARNDTWSSPFDVVKAMTSGLSLQETLDLVVKAAAHVLQAGAATISLRDSNTDELAVEATYGIHSVARGERIKLGATPTECDESNQQGIVVRNVAKSPDRIVTELAEREGFTSSLSVPIELRGSCIGALDVYTRNIDRPIAGEDAEKLAELASLAAIAIENARLFQAETDTATKLRQLERHKNDFVAMIAHELRTPMTSIKGFAQLLLRQNACSQPATAERYARIIETESNRMVSIINDILDISRMETGLLDIWKQPLSIADLIRDIVASRDYVARGHVIEINLPESLPLVRGDPGKIEQVLANLIGNAVKYSPGEEPVQVGASADDEGVTVWVNDRGRSIPVHKFDHIFDKSGGDGVGESRSSGLGLYISKNFVEAHGGKMWVESEEGKGAKFLFKLYY